MKKIDPVELLYEIEMKCLRCGRKAKAAAVKETSWLALLESIARKKGEKFVKRVLKEGGKFEIRNTLGTRNSDDRNGKRLRNSDRPIMGVRKKGKRNANRDSIAKSRRRS